MSKALEKRKGRSKAPSGCANPHCFKSGDKLTVACKHKCGFVAYCCENCQKQHWLTGHQFDCPLQSTFTPNNILSQREWRLFESTPFIKQGELLPASKLSLKKLTIADFETLSPHEERSVATVVGQKMVAAGAGVAGIGMSGEKKRTFLGQGSYGSVELVRYKKTGQMFAMKRLDKNSFANKMQKRSLLQEVEIHKRLVHDNIIRLYHSFEDETFIYLILEYASNGTLFHLIRRRKRLSEEDAFYYFIQACSGVYFLHENNMIHRDIKPENLLIDSNDKIKLCDFGWCVVNQETTTRSTYCGTLQYMAPEMLHNGDHNHTLDLWALGVLLFELLHGHAPFTGRAHLQVKKKIMKKEIQFRANLSEEVKDLISNLLQHEAKVRLPLMKVLIHPWVIAMSKKFNLFDPDAVAPPAPSLQKQHSDKGPSNNFTDFYPIPPARPKAAESDSDLLLSKPSKKLHKFEGSAKKKERVIDLILEQEAKTGRDSSNDVKAKTGSTGSKLSLGATTKPTMSKMSTLSNLHLGALLSERDDPETEAMDMLNTQMDAQQKSQNTPQAALGRSASKLERVCNDLMDQMHIFEKLRDSRRESIKNSPVKGTPLANLKLASSSPPTENFSQKAAVSAMQSYRRQSTVASRNVPLGEDTPNEMTMQTDRIQSFISPNGFDNVSVASGNRTGRRDSKTFIQIFEGTPGRRKKKSAGDAGAFGRSLTLAKTHNALLPPRPDRRKDSAPGLIMSRLANDKGSLQPPHSQRFNMDSPSCFSSKGEYSSNGGGGGVNNTFDTFSSEIDLSCHKRPLLRVNSPYEPVGAKRVGMRNLSSDSRQDTQAIMTPTNRAATNKAVASNSKFQRTEYVKEEDQAAGAAGQASRGVLDRDFFQIQKSDFNRTPPDQQFKEIVPAAARKGVQEEEQGNSFWTKVWSRLNPFGCASVKQEASTSRL